MLLAQVAALFHSLIVLRLMLLAAGPLLIGAMLASISSRPIRLNEGVNIGEAVLVLCLLASLALSFLGLVLEGMRGVRARRLRHHS